MAEVLACSELHFQLVGDSYLGKQTLLEDYSPARCIDVAGTVMRVKLSVFQDPSETTVTVKPALLDRPIDGYIFMYDVSDLESFERVSFWMREVDMHNSKTVSIIQMPKILLGNVDSRKQSVDFDKALAFAESLEILHFRANVENNPVGVERAVAGLATKAIADKQPASSGPSKSIFSRKKSISQDIKYPAKASVKKKVDKPVLRDFALKISTDQSRQRSKSELPDSSSAEHIQFQEEVNQLCRAVRDFKCSTDKLNAHIDRHCNRTKGVLSRTPQSDDNSCSGTVESSIASEEDQQRILNSRSGWDITQSSRQWNSAPLYCRFTAVATGARESIELANKKISSFLATEETFSSLLTQVEEANWKIESINERLRNSLWRAVSVECELQKVRKYFQQQMSIREKGIAEQYAAELQTEREKTRESLKIASDNKQLAEKSKHEIDYLKAVNSSLQGEVELANSHARLKMENLTQANTELRESLRQANVTAEQKIKTLTETNQMLLQQIQQTSVRIETTEEQIKKLKEEVDSRRGQELHWQVEKKEVELTSKQLGCGGWATVNVAKFRGLEVAAKCLHNVILNSYNRRLFEREMNIAAQIRHPNLVQFIGAVIDEEPIILTEMMYTSLREIIPIEAKELTHEQIPPICKDVARALTYLHAMKPCPIIHRDVSSPNILLEPSANSMWKAKLSDYGSANFVPMVKTRGPGNAVYAAPESLIPKLQTTKMDVFSYGVLLVEIYLRELPDPNSREEMVYEVGLRYPNVALLIKNCLDISPSKRLDMSDVLDKLHCIL